MHAEYNVWLILLSIAVAIGVSFAAFSVENLSYYKIIRLSPCQSISQQA
jgi:NO-binding membrane sensor protein with MHYT domain